MLPFDINNLMDFPPLPPLATAQTKTAPRKVHRLTPRITTTPPPTYKSPCPPPPQIQTPPNNDPEPSHRERRDSTPSARASSPATHEHLTHGRADADIKSMNLSTQPLSIQTFPTCPASFSPPPSSADLTTHLAAHLTPSRDTARTPLSSPAKASADGYEEVDECARGPPHASPRYTSATHGVVCAEKDRVGDVGGAQKVLDDEYACLRDWGLRSAVLVGGVVVAVAVGVGFCARMRG